MSITHAMIFAAGLGKRMQPLTLETPKPLIKVCGKPLLEYSFNHLVDYALKHAVVNTHYKAEQVEAYAKTYQLLSITLSHEPRLLETGGGLVKALPLLGNKPFFVMNSDVIIINGKEQALNTLTQHWHDDMDALLLLHEKEKAIGYDGNGDFALDEKGQVTKQSNHLPYVFTGMQIFHPRLLEGKKEEPFSLNVFFKPPYRIYGLVHDGDWLHIGTPEGLRLAEEYFSGQNSEFRVQ